MPKSRLSTVEIRDLKDRGISTEEIARRAGVTKVSVTVRLSPEPQRKRSRERYQFADDEGRRRYLDAGSQRNHELQKETEERATRLGFPWTAEEIEFLRLHGPTMTAFNIAMQLSRTFFGVERASRRYGISLRN